MLFAVSLLLSSALAAYALREGARTFGTCRRMVADLHAYGDTLASCTDGPALIDAARAQAAAEDGPAAVLARTLLRRLDQDPVTLRGRHGWVLDVDDLCDPTHLVKNHPAWVHLEALPAGLTGAGILVSLLSLVVGAYSLDPTATTVHLLRGMSPALLPAIAGIGAAWAWRGRTRAATADARAACARLARVLHDAPFLLAPQDMHLQVLDELCTQVTALQSLEQPMYAAMKRGLRDTGTADLHGDLARLTASLDLRTSLAEPLQAMREQLHTLGGTLADQAESQRLTALAVKRLMQAEVPPAHAAPTAGAGPATAADAAFLADQMHALHTAREQTLAAMTAAGDELTNMMKAARLANADIIKIHGVLVQRLEALEQHWDGCRDLPACLQETLEGALSLFASRIDTRLTQGQAAHEQACAHDLDRFFQNLQGLSAQLASLEATLKQEPAPPRRLFGKRTP